jgi:hypothetical protein
MKRNAVPLFLGLLLATGLFANSRSSKPEGFDLTIKVVKSETRSLTVDNPNVGACDQVNYSAYCKFAATEFPQSRMVVEGGDKIFNITCTAENRWSNCASLPVGDTFKARVEKQGLSILYRGSDGKQHKQLYEVLYAGAAPAPMSPAGAGNAILPAAGSGKSTESTPAVAEKISGSGTAGIIEKPDVTVAPIAPAGKVLCNVISKPAGAEITLDGAYVGNTPSALDLTSGTHQIAMSLPGFEQWTRKIEILPGSNLSVLATMQKAAP